MWNRQMFWQLTGTPVSSCVINVVLAFGTHRASCFEDCQSVHVAVEVPATGDRSYSRDNKVVEASIYRRQERVSLPPVVM